MLEHGDGLISGYVPLAHQEKSWHVVEKQAGFLLL
jgi:hypothetical protein